MANLLPEAQHQLVTFKRQYLQLQSNLQHPEPKYLKQAVFQQALYDEIFSPERIEHQPPTRYQLRILKDLVSRIESSIVDFDEEGISDDLMSHLSTLLSTPLIPEVLSVQQKDYVTYTLSELAPSNLSAPIITLLESRNLLAATGTTGFRTWEACLHLGSYLCSPGILPSLSIRGKNILELGAGTGFLSILCAKYLNASSVVASDGFESVIADLSTNFYLNGLQNDPAISIKELKWGHALFGGEEPSFLDGREPDIVLGADVTYDTNANSALVGTFKDIIQLFPNAVILIAATVRNEKTWENFINICIQSGFEVNMINFAVPAVTDQEGPFYNDGVPIQICNITKGDTRQWT